MKDAYSFDADEDGLNTAFEKQHQAYLKIFDRLDLNVIPVEASSGNMGGSDSIEFMVQAPSGEDDVMLCSSCGYSANIEKAISRLDAITDSQDLLLLKNLQHTDKNDRRACRCRSRW